jgi:hypothetical protein
MNQAEEIRKLKARITNLEELNKKLLTLYSNFVSNKQVQELIAVISEELEEIKINEASLNKRLEILEDIPDIDF